MALLCLQALPDATVEKISNIRYPGNQGGLIVFEGKKRLSFGLGLNEERKYYILQALKNIHSKMKN